METEEIQRQFREFRECLTELKKDVVDCRIDIATLKVKAGVWGLIGALIPTVGLALVWLVMHLLGG